MDTAADTVTQVVTVELIGADGSKAIEAELRYDRRDPYAVTSKFRIGGSQVTWTFGRDLLVHGLYAPTGEGDVHVRPSVDPDGHAVVLIELRSVGGEALVQAGARDLAAFVERMKAAAPPGTESQHMDIDATIAAVLVPNPDD
jgi:hypothetical protein